MKVDFILATLSFITGSYHFSKYIEPQLRSQTTDTRDIYKLMDGCFILSMAVILIILLLFVYFKLFLTYYYLEKYDKEYRKFYKIPDNLWYLSSEEARKRNDPVYPSHKSFPSQRNNKK